MAQCDGTAVGVDLGRIDTELVDAPGCLRGECLIDLEDIDVGDRKSSLLQHLGDGNGCGSKHVDGHNNMMQ
eukprot:CAMPEP_0198116932 /NCGR_PEP_ID=MMETSP1442-20131203/15585_1 /TAXON_ID= /ORGANISM="Craspedostauros australis, Strain CCMP3328" /LENGTH=70 /DNA_ID=CAMNT_0043774869 /DNA_START=414 /DNA_END=626 /DNA_ORIENTATION=+